jgi:uncharacterized membrane protein HdeD (DUF308 family)
MNQVFEVRNQSLPVAPNQASQERWLTRYYFVRALAAIAWVAAAVTLGRDSMTAGAILLVLYPAWDALANLVDAARSGGLGRNRTQALNVAASAAVAVAVGAALPDMHHVLAVFGVWAILSGLLQLGTGVRRWKTVGAQWAMVLSGAQSVLAGGSFIYVAGLPAMPSVGSVAGYAGFGAFYFLVSAVLLTVRARRRAA